MTAGSASTSFTASLSFLTTGSGVPAGAISTIGVWASKPEMPASSRVGTSGSWAARRRLVTAIGRSLPERIWPIDAGT